MKNRIFLAFICMLGVIVLTSCKDKQEEPTQEVATENEVANAPKFIDYGDDNLGVALKELQVTGYYFNQDKFSTPKLIENYGSRVDYCATLQAENGKSYEFMRFSRSLDFDGARSEPYDAVVFVYEDESENLRDAVETYQIAKLSYNVKRNREKESESPRSFMSLEQKSLKSGLLVKDSYTIVDMPNNSDEYEGKHILVFGIDRTNVDKNLGYAFFLQ